MRRIVEGIRYDTEKAKMIGEYDNLHAGADSVSDFQYWQAALYLTPRSGRYFLAGEGGPMTMFAHHAGSNSMSGGEKLIPMSKAEAFDWAERYLDIEVVEQFFDDMIKDA